MGQTEEQRVCPKPAMWVRLQPAGMTAMVGIDREVPPRRGRNHFSREHSALILWFRPGNEMDSRARPTLTIREA